MGYESEPPSDMRVYIQRERIMLMCPDCGIVEGVDKERWATQAFFVNNPPVCTGCAAVMFPVPESDRPLAGYNSG